LNSNSHLLVVAFIPIFVKIINSIIDIIPKYLIKQIFDFLEKMNLIAIWYYVVVFISILIALFIIYIIQKKFFNKERLLERRLLHWECLNCGKHLPIWSKSCPICGTKQLKKCKNCGNETFANGKFCKECGNELTD
jgi:RNA polymerase subunit RPABC4/transcription elongation factor Spt4